MYLRLRQSNVPHCMAMYDLINRHRIHFLGGIPILQIEAYRQRQLRKSQEHLIVQRFEQPLLGQVVSFLFGIVCVSLYLLEIHEQRIQVGRQGSRQM